MFIIFFVIFGILLILHSIKLISLINFQLESIGINNFFFKYKKFLYFELFFEILILIQKKTIFLNILLIILIILDIYQIFKFKLDFILIYAKIKTLKLEGTIKLFLLAIGIFYTFIISLLK